MSREQPAIPNDDGDPLISIIIPAGPNRREELFRCISSIRTSSYKNYEIIVVNNSGRDGLMKEVHAAFPEVRPIELLINTGIYGFNVGFANAKGEYILGIDDDCGVRTDTLQQIRDCFAKKPDHVGVVTANIYNPLYKRWCMEPLVEHKIVNLCCFADGASVFRREVFQKAGYYDEAFFCWQHGADLSIRVLEAGYKIHFDKNIIIDHYEKQVGFRKNRAYFDLRNLAWFNVKNFSIVFFPILIARNMLSLCALPFKHRSIVALFYGLAGYVMGWLTMGIPLRKRRAASFVIQKTFVRHFVFGQHSEQPPSD